MTKILKTLFPILLLIFLATACSGSTGSDDSAAPYGEATVPNVTPRSDESVGESISEPQGNLPQEPEASTPHLLFTNSVTAQGEVIIISGQVLDQGGNPVEGASVEFWQTDENGVYDHPSDSGTETRDKGFQFYGTSITDAEGFYIFRTILPGRYEPRPPHIHVKIRHHEDVLLITQLYFVEFGTEGGLGQGAEQLVVVTDEKRMPDGEMYHEGIFDFVVGVGDVIGGVSLTPSQAEGPYYPVVDVSQFDNDLANVSE